MFSSLVTRRRMLQAAGVIATLAITAGVFAVVSPAGSAADTQNVVNIRTVHQSDLPTTTPPPPPTTLATVTTLPAVKGGKAKHTNTTVAPTPKTTVLSTPANPARPALYGLIAQTTDQTDLAWYASEERVVVQGGWTENPDQFILRLEDFKTNQYVFVYLVNNKAVNAQTVADGATHQFEIGAHGTYKGTSHVFLESFSTADNKLTLEKAWIIDETAHTFTSVPVTEITWSDPQPA